MREEVNKMAKNEHFKCCDNSKRKFERKLRKKYGNKVIDSIKNSKIMLKK